eukprot:CAMPEP_0183341258 /NCGR_PEP_ID=MMETSP0164_2-20130417/7530_1 /TAXON_ID=221442 /ORGANISM="Coccolithus pelagicus ssp braarudi, Strain PLY182g" /LENGTH=125 /DNA_ID=CAMNT_0025511521 /DNA_START=265 /DNA_END=639 /DNA_ORIENTATION=+
MRRASVLSVCALRSIDCDWCCRRISLIEGVAPLHPLQEALPMLRMPHPELQLEQLVVEKVTHEPVHAVPHKRGGILLEREGSERLDHVSHAHLAQAPAPPLAPLFSVTWLTLPRRHRAIGACSSL